jgi:predicted metal-binding membrane protein
MWPVLFLAAVAGVCWAMTVERTQGMGIGPGTYLGGLGWFVALWVTMMTAMMLPSLTPVAVASTRPRARAAS